MGFSVSGSAALIFVGLFLAGGTFMAATTNSFERVSDARDDAREQALAQENTAITVENATWNDGETRLSVNATNDGATTLALDAVDLVVDNEYVTPDATAIDGDDGTGVWAPGQRLRIDVTSLSSQPTRVKLVTGPGVAGFATVEVV